MQHKQETGTPASSLVAVLLRKYFEEKDKGLTPDPLRKTVVGVIEDEIDIEEAEI
jgi:hypothetical protein